MILKQLGAAHTYLGIVGTIYLWNREWRLVGKLSKCKSCKKDINVISARKAQNFESILSRNFKEIEPISKLQPKRSI
jgi:hypothetical protein